MYRIVPPLISILATKTTKFENRDTEFPEAQNQLKFRVIMTLIVSGS